VSIAVLRVPVLGVYTQPVLYVYLNAATIHG